LTGGKAGDWCAPRIDDAFVSTCPICGRRYDELAYQLVVEGLGTFDSTTCVEEALRRQARERRELAFAQFDVISAAHWARARTTSGPSPKDRGNNPYR
jgi:hypothetical protein